MKADVKREWNGEDAFVIGGGASLKNFDFGRLEGRHSLGVNDAFRLGPSRCSRVIFGDNSWWQKNKWDLEKYANDGIVYSVCINTERFNVPWMVQFTRINTGWSRLPDRLGWNYNTGAAAVNLAVLLGAKRVFLLGFDMNTTKGESHWHRHRKAVTTEASFQRFIKGFDNVAGGAKKDGVSVFNVGDGASRLSHFPKITFDQMEDLCR